MNVLSGFADISFWQLVPVAAVALFASIIGGVSGYGTGALMPLVLVPLVGAEPVVPIIAISALFTNSSRVFAFLKYADWRRAAIVLAASVPTCVLGAWGYTRLSSAGAALVIGGMLIASVPLRRLMRYHGFKVGDAGLGLGSLGYGLVVGGTAGSGVILLSLLMAAGVEGAGVIATDAAISIVIGIVKISVFGLVGVITAQSFCAFDRDRGAARGLPGQGFCRAHAGPCTHGDPRRGGAIWRRISGLWRVALRRFDEGHGHFTTGGIEDRIDSTLPPVRSPKIVPRS